MPFVSNVTGHVDHADEATVAGVLDASICAQRRAVSQPACRTLLATDRRVFLEVGPGRTLASLGAAAGRGRPGPDDPATTLPASAGDQADLAGRAADARPAVAGRADGRLAAVPSGRARAAACRCRRIRSNASATGSTPPISRTRPPARARDRAEADVRPGSTCRRGFAVLASAGPRRRQRLVARLRSGSMRALGPARRRAERHGARCDARAAGAQLALDGRTRARSTRRPPTTTRCSASSHGAATRRGRSSTCGTSDARWWGKDSTGRFAGAQATRLLQRALPRPGARPTAARQPVRIWRSLPTAAAVAADGCRLAGENTGLGLCRVLRRSIRSRHQAVDFDVIAPARGVDVLSREPAGAVERSASPTGTARSAGADAGRDARHSRRPATSARLRERGVYLITGGSAALACSSPSGSPARPGAAGADRSTHAAPRDAWAGRRPLRRRRRPGRARSRRFWSSSRSESEVLSSRPTCPVLDAMRGVSHGRRTRFGGSTASFTPPGRQGGVHHASKVSREAGESVRSEGGGPPCSSSRRPVSAARFLLLSSSLRRVLAASGRRTTAAANSFQDASHIGRVARAPVSASRGCVEDVGWP